MGQKKAENIAVAMAEGYAEALTEKRITENNNINADRTEDRLLETIVSRENLNKAYKQVKKNKGAHGVDGMKVEELLNYLKENGEALRQSRVEIPKDNKKKRKLGIPTAVDRVVHNLRTAVL